MGSTNMCNKVSRNLTGNKSSSITGRIRDGYPNGKDGSTVSGDK